MHEGQLEVDAETARRLIAENFPAFRGATVVPVAQHGTVTAVYRVGASACARFPLVATDVRAAREWLMAEARAADEFAATCPFAAPVSIGVGEPGWSFPMPWALQTWVPGHVTSPTGQEHSPVFAEDLVTLLVALCSADTRGRQFSGPGRGGRLADHDASTGSHLLHSHGFLDVTGLSRLWQRLCEGADATSFVMSHKDLTPANIVVSGDRIVGVLDAGGFGPADPALDLVSVWHMLDRHRRHLVRDRLEISSTEWRRGAAWAFAQAVGLVWYYRDSNPGMSELGRSTLRRLLEDPEFQ